MMSDKIEPDLPAGLDQRNVSLRSVSPAVLDILLLKEISQQCNSQLLYATTDAVQSIAVKVGAVRMSVLNQLHDLDHR